MSEYEQMVIMKELLESYDADYRAQIFEPLNVKTNFYVQMLSEIDQTAMDYEMTIFFRWVFKSFVFLSELFDIILCST